MGNRLSKIYTRTGDDGTTGLGDGSRVEKDDPRVEAIGTVDELNSAIGVLLTHETSDAVRAALTGIQHALFDIGGELCIPGTSCITAEQVEQLEQLLDGFNVDLPALKEFILPGGTRAAAACHMARAICRRAERRSDSLGKQAGINPASLQYLNRLSDLLFVMARCLNKQAGEPDVFWQHEREVKSKK
jgi:cob(I)alamin adenosyltransferase